jgi:hypothetical protein
MICARCPLRLLKQAQHPVAAGSRPATARCAAEGAEVEYPSDDRRNREQVLTSFREPTQPRLHGVEHRRGDDDTPGVLVRASIRSALAEYAGDLRDEERVPVRPAAHGGHYRRRGHGAGRRRDHPRDLRLVKTAQVEPITPRHARERRDRLLERMAAAQRVVPIGGQHQHARISDLPREETQQEQGGCIPPLEVIEDHDERTRARGGGKDGGGGHRQAEPGLVRRGDGRFRQPG